MEEVSGLGICKRMRGIGRGKESNREEICRAAEIE